MLKLNLCCFPVTTVYNQYFQGRDFPFGTIKQEDTRCIISDSSLLAPLLNTCQSCALKRGGMKMCNHFFRPHSNTNASLKSSICDLAVLFHWKYCHILHTYSKVTIELRRNINSLHQAVSQSV